MNPAIIAGLTGAAVIALVISEHQRWSLGVWIAKPLASVGFVAMAWILGATGTEYGRWILAAMVLCLVGDVLLIPKRQIYFVVGLGSFLLGHVAFAAAFFANGFDPRIAFIAAFAVLALAVGITRWMWPHVPRKLRVPVLFYVGALATMVTLAAGTGPTERGGLIVPGAIAFFLSDISVARDRFVAPGFINKLWGLPLYYAAQLILASTC